MIYNTKTAIMDKAKEAINVPFWKIDKFDRLSSSKGSVGQMIEESFFEYKINNESEPDFKEAGVELKVSPYIKNKNGTISAKERIVLNMINYMKEYLTKFETSSFWNKNKCIQMMFYQYLSDKPKSQYFISDTIQFSFPEDDLKIVMEDFEKILFKIKNGMAHELSEADTMYLGACTKGANSDTLRTQPNSDILAKQRAYCLKQSYATQILRQYVFGEEQSEKIIKDSSILNVLLFETYLEEKLSKHFGKSQKQLIEELNILNDSSKAINEIIITKLLGIKGKLSNTDEFKKANIIPKFIRLNREGKSVKESMSFPTFKFNEIINENWEDSNLYSMFTETKFLFVIFQFDSNNELIFKGIKFWNMPYIDLIEVEKAWNRTVNIIKEGVILTTDANGIIHNNLPKSKENKVCHVRPHARNAIDTYDLPDGRKLTKQCFWLNNSYIINQILDN